MPKDNSIGLMQGDNLNGYNQFPGGFTKDLFNLYSQDNLSKWNLARNAVSLSPTGDFNSVSNEMANRLVAKAPYTIIGRIYINNGEWGIFSTDETNSEIGIFNEHTNEYIRFVNSKELNFHKSNLIKGVGRIKRYGHRMLYWDDDLNPSRYIDLDNIPWKGEYLPKNTNDECLIFNPYNDYKYEYQDKNNSNNIDGCIKTLDVKKILLSPNTTKGLSFKLSPGKTSGEMLNGTYAVVGYYSLGGSANQLTGYYSISAPQVLFSHSNMANSLSIDVVDVDDDFEEFTLVIITFENMNYDARILGSYSTSTRHINVQQIDQKLAHVDINQILSKCSFPEKTAEISRVGNYLVRTKPTQHQDFNYQLLANDIKVNWVSIAYDKDYYKNGGSNMGYMRDEVYSFFIRWIYNTGDFSKSYHIPGRQIGRNLEARELSEIDGLRKGEILEDGGRIVSFGEMAFWESEEKYEDKKPEVWGNLCGKNIRHHKMPGNNISAHFGNEEIYVLGVHFSNIKKPTKKVKEFNEDGTYKWVDKEIDNIIGYEILRGSREGNKSILAKGIINNMRGYAQRTIDGEYQKTVYYQNYPYNSTQIDQFITSEQLIHSSIKKPDQTGISGKSMWLKTRDGNNEIPYGTESDLYVRSNYIRKDLFTFHSPDMKGSSESYLNDTFLTSKELISYGYVKGKMSDIKFFEPKGSPKQKLLNNTGLTTTIIIGLGYAIFKMFGKRRHVTNSPGINYGPAMAGYGVFETSNGLTGVSAPNAIVKAAGVTAENIIKGIWSKLSDNLKTISAASGVDIESTADEAIDQSATTTGAIHGDGSTTSTETEQTEWKSIPKWLRVMSSVPIFMTYWLESMNNIIEMMYSFAIYKNHTLQQVSHGYYNEFKPFDNNVTITREIDNQTYLSRSAITMLGDKETEINNVLRPEAIAIKLKEALNEKTSSKEFKENSQILLSTYETNTTNDIDTTIQSRYVALKQPLNSQYGQLRNIKQISATHKVISINGENGFASNEKVVFGGDVFISRYTEKNNMLFFYNFLKDQPDGTQFDYSLYKLIASPRFWMDTTPYDLERVSESMSKLFGKSGISDFEPFAFASRFSDSNVIVETKKDNYTFINFETQFNPNFKSIYPEVVSSAYDDFKNNNNEEYDDKDELENDAIEEANGILSSFNSNRICGCLYKKIYSDLQNKTFCIDSSYLKLIKEIRSNDELNSNGIITDSTSFYNTVPNQDDFIYNRNNQYSPINCQFFNYKKIDGKDNPYDSSEDQLKTLYDNYQKEQGDTVSSNQEFKRNISTKSLWYDKPYRLGLSDYDKLCKYKDQQEKAELDYAIALGYIHFMQMYWPGKDVDKDKYSEDFSSLCWFRNGKYYDKAKEAYDNFSEPWTDDILNGGKKFKTGMRCSLKSPILGSYDDIPYTLSSTALNPLLAYFISQETDIKINYPTIEELSNNWNSILKGSTKFGYNDIPESGSKDGYYDFGYNTSKNKWIFDGSRIFNSFEEWGMAINDKASDQKEFYGYKNKNIDSFIGEDNDISNNMLSYMDAKNLVYSKKYKISYNETLSKLNVETLKSYLKSYTKLVADSIGKSPDEIATEYREEIEDTTNNVVYKFVYILADPQNKEYDEEDNDEEFEYKEWDHLKDTEYFDNDYDVINKIPVCGAKAYYYVYLENQEELFDEETGSIEDFSNGAYDDKKPVDFNQYLIALIKLNEISYDKFYIDENNKFKYWTLNGCREILNLKKRVPKNPIKRGYYYAFDNSNDRVAVPFAEKCNRLKLYFEDKGVLHRKVKRLYRNQEKASRKYNKRIQRYNNKYNKTIRKIDGTGFLQKIKKTLNNMTPGSYYALDFSIKDERFNYNVASTILSGGLNKMRMFIDKGYMYTFVSGIRDFYVESTRNISCRNWGETDDKEFYDPGRFTDLERIFSSDVIKNREYFEVFKTLIPENICYNTGFFTNAVMQNRLYDPIESAERLERFHNRMLYSDPSVDTDLTDGWRFFKMNDKFDFNDEITTVLQTQDEGALVLFKNTSPIAFVGTINLKSENAGLRTTVGSGELFSNNNMRHLTASNSFESASCQDSLSAINTPAGIYYSGSDQGRFYTYSKQSPIDITTIGSGLTQWFKKYEPYILTKNTNVFKNKAFELVDNPVAGIGIQTTYDNKNMVVFMSKKDYDIKKQYKDLLIYEGNGLFRLKGHGVINGKIKLGDKKYFNDASFTISCDLKKGNNGVWYSFHDWHPDLTMSSSEYFYTTKDNGIWRHNDSASKYCNFYGENYPFEVEIQLHTKNEVSTLRSVSYFLETFVYDTDNEYDRYHTLFDNFDHAYVYNSEQFSGMLNLIHQDDNDPQSIIEYPRLSKDKKSFDILWSKEEQRYRFNQFWDITKDRMDKDYNTMFKTSPNGYIREINDKYVNYNKDDFEKKKFRHMVNNIRLIKDNSENVNFVLNVNYNFNQKSYR